MKFLHTADWHVGKTLRGRSRAEEHRAVLAEIVRIAAEREVDFVLVAGDLFDTAAPSPESEEIVYRALLELSRTGAAVVVVAGNHDNPRRLAAVRPLLDLTGVHAAHAPRRPEDGGVLALEARSGGRARFALLPFLSQRGIVRAEQLMSGDAADHAQRYAGRAAGIVRTLTEGAREDEVNLLLAHLLVDGGVFAPDGGERSAHTVSDYAVPIEAFGPNLHYVALGHLHRAQRIPGACPIWYSGSPLQLDFGESADVKAVQLIEAEPGRPARVESVELREGRRLRRVRGRLERLVERQEEFGDDWLRVELDERPRPGLADEARERLGPGVVDVAVTRREPEGGEGTATRRIGVRSPQELFAAYLAERGEEDADLKKMFGELLEDVNLPAASVETE